MPCAGFSAEHTLLELSWCIFAGTEVTTTPLSKEMARGKNFPDLPKLIFKQVPLSSVVGQFL